MPKATILLTAALSLANCGQSATAALESWRLKSPDGGLTLAINLKDGRLFYGLDRSDIAPARPILAPSPLGLDTDAGKFTRGLRFVDFGVAREVDEPYEMSTGKQRHLRDHYRERSLTLANADDARLIVDFRLYDDGLAFRYRLPSLPHGGARIHGETTGFQFPSEGKAWLQPYSRIALWAPAYEEYYTNGSPLGQDAPHEEGWAFPALFELPSAWVLLTEADLDGTSYGAHLDATVRDRTYTIRLPLHDSAEGMGDVEPQVQPPWAGAWRLVITGPTLATIAESSLVHHVSRPPDNEQDFSWVHPGRATWSWWSHHASSRDYDGITPFIDLAADWGWEYSLVDANWNRMENGSIEQLIDYAHKRGVGLFLWYNSGGKHNVVTEEPRDRLLTPDTREAEFGRLERMGVAGVKVDFFQSDKPWMIQHYLNILRDAAAHHLLVDFHGCTIPRGWQRTYPNLMSMEAVRGAEVYSCCEDHGPNAVWQNTILPFTRNVIESMDYTPVTFTNQKVPHQTTFAHELALSVLFESGVQHFADAVDGYRNLPDYAQAWLKSVPVAWDETRFVAGYPGELAVLARRRGETWFIGGANGTKAPNPLSLRFPFLAQGSYALEVIRDGSDGRSFTFEEGVFRASDSLQIDLPPAGGFVAKLTPQ